MIQCQLKLRLTKRQEATAESWLPILGAIYNFAVRKIELNARDKIYFGKREFNNLLTGHSQRLEIPAHVLQGVLSTAYMAWSRCFKKISSKPRLKGMRNKMTSIPFPDPIRPPCGNRVTLLGFGPTRFHRQQIPEGTIKSARIVKRASGWHLCLFVDAEPKAIERMASGRIGIDSGFSNLLTTSDGEIIDHPRELEACARRLAQAQRGNNRHMAARIQERIANRKKDRNHKISRRLVSENILIAFSKDNIKGIAKRFGKSVASSAHYQLRRMLSYKMPKSGGTYVETEGKFSTKTCSTCGALSGPTGLAGLSVRQWVCPCGAEHDRDINAARNTLIAAAGCAVKEVCHV